MKLTKEELIQYCRTYPKVVDFEWTENSGESFELKGFRLFQRYLLVVRGNGIILNLKLWDQTTYNKKAYSKEVKKALLNCRRQVIWKSNYLFVSDIWSEGPYHFYIDVISKLLNFVKMGYDISRYSIVLMDCRFIRDTGIPFLKDIDLEPKEVILLDQSSCSLFLGKNYFLSKPHVMGSNNPLIINELQARMSDFANKVLTSVQSLPDKVYYFRKNRSRLVVNDNEVIPVLEKMGFLCCDFDNLSYREAWTLMSEVRVFVGIHGGGLTNMIFMPPNGKVIEIKTDNPNPQNHCYWHLARSLNQQYVMFTAEGVTGNVIEGKGCDVYVDIDELSKLLKIMNIE